MGLNMESKYYTPTIEEFHVGFEFEYLNSTNNTWYNQIFNRGIGFENNPSIDKCRVKYLDKKDIESLGWKFTGKSIDIWFKKEGMFFAVSGGHKFTAYKLQYGLHDNRLKVEAFFGEESEGVLFEGIIKNKSELKKLMKQLGIYE